MTTKAELKAKISELQAQVDAMPDKPKPLKGRVLDKDYKGKSFAVFLGDQICSGCASQDCINIGVEFNDKKSAKRYARYLELVQQMRVIASQYEPCDWGDDSQNKYHIQFDPDEPTLDIGVSIYTKSIGVIHCTDSEALEDFVNSLSEYDRECLAWGNE